MAEQTKMKHQMNNRVLKMHRMKKILEILLEIQTLEAMMKFQLIIQSLLLLALLNGKVIKMMDSLFGILLMEN